MKTFHQFAVIAIAGASFALSSCSTGGSPPSDFLRNYKQLDAGYGTDGVATTLLGDVGSARVAVAPDGAAVTVTRRNKVVLAHRWTSEGELDASFSADGVRELPFGELHRRSSSLVTVDSQGRVVAAAMIAPRVMK